MVGAIMNMGEIIAFTTFGVSILGIVGFVLGNTRAEATKRERIWARMDEVKKATEETFVRKDLCGQIHKDTSEDIKEMKSDIKKILFKINGDKDE